MIHASDILSGGWHSAGFPYRYLVIWHGKELFAKFRNTGMDKLLSAVETIEDQGWELVSVDEAVSVAVLRRVDRPGTSGDPHRE